jgi:hypothetical protein
LARFAPAAARPSGLVTRGGFFPPLRQHVGIAAGIFGEPAIAFRQHQSGGHPVQEIAIMADNQRGARIIGNHLFQQIQGFQVQVVGRFVQHQEVGRRGEHLGQQQPRALATRQHLDGCAPVAA